MISRVRREEYVDFTSRGIYRLSDSWLATADAYLLRGGSGSALSHRCAAHLHGFDGYELPGHVDLTVRPGSAFRKKPAVRSATLSSDQIVTVRDRPTTSVVRTLLDLGRFATIDELEMAVESALRSTNPKTPTDWNKQLLAGLIDAASNGTSRNQQGAHLRAVLARRPDGCRPTGSPAETRALQILRNVGFGDLHRQPTVSVIDHSTDRTGTFFPDLFDLRSYVGIEIDGEGYHLERIAQDRQRDNLLGEPIRILRYDAKRTLYDRASIASEVAATIAVRRTQPWPAPPWTARTVAGSLVLERR